MGYQLGLPNLTEEWPKFMDAMKRAGESAQGSLEQFTALAEARFHMLYNEAADGATKLTKWATQTKDRAFEMADAMIADFDMPSLIGNAMADEEFTASDIDMVSEEGEGTVLNTFVEQDIDDFLFRVQTCLLINLNHYHLPLLVRLTRQSSSAWNKITGGDVEPITVDSIGDDTMVVITLYRPMQRLKV